MTLSNDTCVTHAFPLTLKFDDNQMHKFFLGV